MPSISNLRTRSQRRNLNSVRILLFNEMSSWFNFSYDTEVKGLKLVGELAEQHHSKITNHLKAILSNELVTNFGKEKCMLCRNGSAQEFVINFHNNFDFQK
mmetsp:Transcript_41212/g.86210  ORF Transcript_41212/g.86210 Transcript_41212/m.86210 type:complete len:101 (+) Transcript_41212:1047-1349(+)